MRSLGFVVLAAVALGFAGCGAPSAGQVGVQPHPGQAVAVGLVTPHLLFDRHPSEVFLPQHFTYRSGWPEVENGFSGGELIEYEEHFIDRERDFPSFSDQTYRRFTTRRVGVSFR